MKKRRPYDRYKEKNCVRCGKKHRKRGPYCSMSCGNVRSFTEAEKEQRRQKMNEYFKSEDGLALAATTGKNNFVGPKEYAVDIPTILDISDTSFDGYDRAEDW